MVSPWESRRRELEAEFGEPITVDGLSATWKIFQRRNGHRHSTDDLLTAWFALDAVDRGGLSPSRTLDLGTGIGGVGLLVLSGLASSARLTCVEAQDVSFRFLVENIRANDLVDRVDAHHGDLRTFDAGATFSLVTGSPPYFDPGAGIVPADSQKAHARFELRGDVGDYARAAKRHLAPGGTFVFCFPFAQKARAMSLVVAEGFHFVSIVDVVPREGLAPLFSLYECRLAQVETRHAKFVVRHADGRHTPLMDAVRARFGWEV